MDLTNLPIPPASRPFLDGIAADLGLVPNLAATAAASPTLLAGFDALRRAVAAIDPVRREVTGLAVGLAVDNRYGVAFHSKVLAGLGVDPATIGADPHLAAVHALATELVVRRGKVDDGTVAATGLSPEEVLEVVLEATFATLVGLIDNLAGRVELDAFLVPA